MKSFKTCTLLSVLGTLLFVVGATSADDRSTEKRYEVIVTNLTRGQSFTPILAATHTGSVSLYTLGKPASDELAALAEGGDTAPLDALLSASPRVAATTTTAGLLASGDTIGFTIRGGGQFNRLSLAAMMIPTNDGFIAFQSVGLPKGRNTQVVYVPAYDAGSEDNDEQCFSIPGPVCGGEGGSPGISGEGYVHVHGGIHGFGDLASADYDWRNPVARISIRRLR